MTELRGVGGTWTLDDDVIRIVPGQDRKVHPVRRAVGELSIPLAAVAWLAFEPGRKGGGRLRLRLRGGSDALWHVCAGRLPDDADPFQIAVADDRSGVAEYFADAVRSELVAWSGDSSPLSYRRPAARGDANRFRRRAGRAGRAAGSWLAPRPDRCVQRGCRERFARRISGPGH